jgi:hypothetical protein
MSGEAVERVKCTDCTAMILPRTARDNAGLCGRCAKLCPASRADRKAFHRSVTSGDAFAPSAAELASGAVPEFLADRATNWRPEPEFYAGTPITNAAQALAEASSKRTGQVYLTAGKDIWLELAFNEARGVCYLTHAPSSLVRYAFTSTNERQQVSADQHLLQGCPCCGVGLQWFPSRFHMPRKTAFEITAAIAAGKAAPCTWLDAGDFSRTRQGFG